MVEPLDASGTAARKPSARRIRRVPLFAAARDKLARIFLWRLSKRIRKKRFPIIACLPHDRLGYELTAQGLFEEHLILALLESIVGPRSEAMSRGIALDVGANIGNHALMFARCFDRVIAVEPNPPAALLLRANLLLNNVNNIDVVETALGDEETTLTFYASEPGRNLGNAGFDPRYVGAGMAGQTRPCETGDGFLRRLGLNKPIAFVKIDVEGFEEKVIRGLRDTLASQKPVLMFESQPASAEEANRVLEFLRELGYRSFYSLDQRPISPPAIRPRQLRSLIGLFQRLIAGNDYYLFPLDGFEPKRYYAAILASAEPL